MMTRKFAFTLIAVLLAGCATQAPAPGGAEPEITIYQLSNVASVARNDQGPLSVQYALEVRNPGKDPLHLSRATVQSIGYGAYELPSHSQAFDVAIPAGKSTTVKFWANGFTNPSVVGANGPVTLRVAAEFGPDGNHYQRTVVQTVNANGGVDR
jgi:hypothetical protein